MSSQSPTLHLVCGKIAAGKSTLTAKLGDADATIVIAEDDWLGSLYADQMTSIQDFVRCSNNLRNAMSPHIVSLLNAGTSVVLDFQANTIESREWMMAIIRETGVAHQLHHLDVPDEVCKARLRERNEQGDHPFVVSEDQFDQITEHFVAPTSSEGFNVVLHKFAGV